MARYPPLTPREAAGALVFASHLRDEVHKFSIEETFDAAELYGCITRALHRTIDDTQTEDEES